MSNKTEFVFIELGKNASCSLKPAMRKLGIALYGLNHSNPRVRTRRHVIFCYRNPVDRFLSAWRSRYEKGWPDYFPNPWHSWELRVFAKYDTPETFLNEVIGGRETFPRQGHFVPQSKVLEEVLDDQIFFVLDFSNLQYSFNYFCRKIDQPSFVLRKKHTSDTSLEKPPSLVPCPNNYKELSSRSIAWLKDYYHADSRFKRLCQ